VKEFIGRLKTVGRILDEVLRAPKLPDRYEVHEYFRKECVILVDRMTREAWVMPLGDYPKFRQRLIERL
jgi:hypothetical protein